MRFLILFFFFFAASYAAEAQVKPPNSQQAEMQQAIDEIKKEIRKLEEEIKKTTDAEEAASLKKELASLKSMLSMFEKTSKPVAQTSKPAPVKNTPSPITPVVVKQPYTIPTAAQATDRLLWYKGRKINDSTLVTVKGLLVQYNKNNKKRSIVKIQPPKKSDPFDSMVVAFTNIEKRKEALINKFDKLKNGFMFYTELRTALAFYDDLNKRMEDVLKNTIELPEMTLPERKTALAFPQPSRSGPYVEDETDTIPGKNETYAEEIGRAMQQQMALAKKLYQELPPAALFPAPPKHEPGMCSNCDSSVIKKQYKLDSIWINQYLGKEQKILQMVFGVERQASLLGVEVENMSEISFFLFEKMMQRGVEKAKILYDKYGSDLRCSKVVMQVILGLERQIQLLGMSESTSFNGLQFLLNKLGVYEQYLDEQIQAKNHDFVLNIASHLGYLRQKALLGASENQDAENDKMIARINKYNRFELIMETDFIVEERNEDNELEFKATGAMATKEKIYGMFIPDSCKYKMIPYTTDFSNASLQDVSILFHVKSGVKTLKDENGKPVNYNYTGPDTYSLTFPDFKVDFCNTNQTDTAVLLTFTAGKDLDFNINDLSYTKSKSYKTDFLIMANLVFVTNDLPQKDQEFETVGEDIFNTIGGFQTTNTNLSTLEKLKMQYEGKTQMDNHRKSIQNLVNDKQSVIEFTANNRQTVVTDKFTDTKRKLEDEGLELTRGLIHLKILHTPVQ